MGGGALARKKEEWKDLYPSTPSSQEDSSPAADGDLTGDHIPDTEGEESPSDEAEKSGTAGSKAAAKKSKDTGTDEGVLTNAEWLLSAMDASEEGLKLLKGCSTPEKFSVSANSIVKLLQTLDGTASVEELKDGLGTSDHEVIQLYRLARENFRAEAALRCWELTAEKEEGDKRSRTDRLGDMWAEIGMKPVSKSSHEKLRRVGKFVREYKWVLLADVGYTDLAGLATSWKKLLQEQPKLKERSDSLLKLAEALIDEPEEIDCGDLLEMKGFGIVPSWERGEKEEPKKKPPVRKRSREDGKQDPLTVETLFPKSDASNQVKDAPAKPTKKKKAATAPTQKSSKPKKSQTDATDSK